MDNQSFVTKRPWWRAVLCVLSVFCSVEFAQAAPDLGSDSGAVRLTEVVLTADSTEDRQTSWALPDVFDEPLLVAYVAATRSAKRCVMTLVEPLKAAQENSRPLKMVNVLDLSHANVLIRWIIKSVYRADREDNSNPRVRFFLDETGGTQSEWGVAGATCAFTFYHPDYAPLSALGVPPNDFIKEILARLRHD